jgi:hypothetical protein
MYNDLSNAGIGQMRSGFNFRKESMDLAEPNFIPSMPFEQVNFQNM